MAEQAVVLVVDDDPVVRMFVCGVLDDNGFAVLVASSADEALSVLRSRHDVAVVLTDIVMPGTLDGLGLVSEMRRRRPRPGLVVWSGLMPPEAAGNASDTVFLSKPFQETDLLAALAQAQASHA